ncbi:hypothetical protein CASFOL_001438 [Castilleja foliolosa]|uniref:Uncharacterized protein n=1 Tax=Castilleja foliolosa TaxID=1961234 RepID=A0ABD3EJW6_9LAMI
MSSERTSSSNNGMLVAGSYARILSDIYALAQLPDSFSDSNISLLLDDMRHYVRRCCKTTNILLEVT